MFHSEPASALSLLIVLSLWGNPRMARCWRKSDLSCYSLAHISSDTAFFKILKKPSIVQEKTLPHMNLLGFLIEKKENKIF